MGGCGADLIIRFGVSVRCRKGRGFRLSPRVLNEMSMVSGYGGLTFGGNACGGAQCGGVLFGNREFDGFKVQRGVLLEHAQEAVVQCGVYHIKCWAG